MNTGRNRKTALRHILFASFASLCFSPAYAQLGLPNVPSVPAIPPLDLPDAVNRVTQDVESAANNTLTTANARAQAGLRATRIRELLRANRDTVEADPNGAPMVRSQLVGWSPGAEALAKISAAGFAVIEDRVLVGLGLRYVVFAAPVGMSTRRALSRLRALDPGGSYDYNHIYTESGEVTSPHTAASPGPGALTLADTKRSAASGTRLGLIDGGIATTHPVFHTLTLHHWGCDGAVIPSAHGTAVASLMVGQTADFHSAAAGATLYAADVYCGKPTGGALRDLANAFSWLAQEQVPIVNVSLVGPPNILLEQLVRNMIARGHIIVAAVGNDGPAAKPLYPAAYPDVVGVTAVDAHDRVLVEAARGKQVDFAAPGADIAAANLSEGFTAVRGTSFAAPIVAGLLGPSMQTPDHEAADRAVARLATIASDLGPRGVDPNYGKGLVGQAVRVSLAATLAHIAQSAQPKIHD